MKRILIVSNMYPSKEHPHYGIFVEHCANILKRAGNKVSVISLTKKNSKIQKLFSYGAFYTRTIFNGLLGQYDVIYAHYASHTALPLLVIHRINNKYPIVINVHGNDIVPDCAADKKNIKRSYKILNVCSKVVCPSSYYQNILVNNYGVNTAKICIYPSGGVDVSTFCKIDRTHAVKQLALNPEERYIGYVGRFEEKKGWDIFLKACEPIVKIYPEIKLIIIGDGAQKAAYASMVKRLQLEDNIIYRPLMRQTELVYVYNALDLFVFPTFRESESLGLVGLEAMACECLVLASDQYGPASYVRNGVNGYQFLTGNYLDARKQIEKILFAKENTEKIKKAARETALHYSNEETDPILLDLFSNIGSGNS